MANIKMSENFLSHPLNRKKIKNEVSMNMENIVGSLF